MNKVWHRLLGFLPRRIAAWLRLGRMHAADRARAAGGQAKSAAPPLVPPPVEETDGAGAATLEQHVSRILSTNPLVQGGSVQLIGLDPLRDRLGPRWPALRERIRGLAERLLSQVLSPRDVYFPHGEDTYIIVFAHLDAERAALICGKILMQLQKILLGDVDTATITVRTAVHSANGLEIKSTSLQDLLNTLAVHWTRQQQDAAPPPAPTPAVSPDAAPPMLWEEMHLSRNASSAVMITSTKTASPSVHVESGGAAGQRPAPPLGPEFVQEPDFPPSPSVTWVTPDDRGGSHTGWWAASSMAESAQGPLEIVFRPIWNVATQSLRGYRVLPRRRSFGLGMVHGYGVHPGLTPDGMAAIPLSPEAQQDVLDMDLTVLRRAVDLYLSLPDPLLRYGMWLPVHYESLANTQRRMAYIALSSKIPATLRPLINFTLYGVVEGMPSGRMAELAGGLRAFGDGMGIFAAHPYPPIPPLAAAGLRVVATTLPTGWPVDRVLEDLERYCGDCRRQGVRVHVSGINSLETLEMVEQAAVFSVTGDLISDDLELPSQRLNLTRRSLTRRARENSFRGRG